MPKVLFCNSFDITHMKEAVCLTFKFEAPDGNTETIYIITSPEGAKTLNKVLTDVMNDFEKKYGKLKVWKPPDEKKDNNNNCHYLS